MLQKLTKKEFTKQFFDQPFLYLETVKGRTLTLIQSAKKALGEKWIFGDPDELIKTTDEKEVRYKRIMLIADSEYVYQAALQFLSSSRTIDLCRIKDQKA